MGEDEPVDLIATGKYLEENDLTPQVPRVTVRLPEDEPRPRTVYGHADDFLGVVDNLQSEKSLRDKLRTLRRTKAAEENAWAGPVGFSTRPRATRVVPLCRKRYETHAAAVARFEEMQRKYGWRVVGEPYWTAAYWCWRISC